MTVALMVTYPTSEGAHFDRDYYVTTHLPLVDARWGPHGLTGATGYFPEGPGTSLAISVLHFRDAAARDAALGSAEAAEVFGDIPNFTNVQPTPLPLTVA